MLTRLLIVAFAVALASPVFAGPNDAEWNPPARFDRTFRGALEIIRLPQSDVPAACKKLFGDNGLNYGVTPRQRGCAYHTGDFKHCTIIVMDRPAFGTTPAAVIRHELGHCAGWPADHPY